MRHFNIVRAVFDDRVAIELAHESWSENLVTPVTAVAPDFSWIAGDKAEWRLLNDETPVALILRIGWTSDRAARNPAATRLLVFRIDAADRGRSCLVGAVSGRAGGNEAARAMADQAEALPCLR